MRAIDDMIIEIRNYSSDVRLHPTEYEALGEYILKLRAELENLEAAKATRVQDTFAFPNPDLGVQHFSDPGAYPGMTLRQYYIGRMAIGMLKTTNPTAQAKYIARMADELIKASHG